MKMTAEKIKDEYETQNRNILRNFRRLSASGRIIKFAEYDDAIPQFAKTAIRRVQSVNGILRESFQTQQSLTELMASPKALRKYSVLRREVTALTISDMFDGTQNHNELGLEDAKIYQRCFDGIIGIIILIESAMIWFRLFYKDTVPNTVIHTSLIIEACFESVFLLDLYLKIKVLPHIYRMKKGNLKTIDFVIDIFGMLHMLFLF